MDYAQQAKMNRVETMYGVDTQQIVEGGSLVNVEVRPFRVHELSTLHALETQHAIPTHVSVIVPPWPGELPDGMTDVAATSQIVKEGDGLWRLETPLIVMFGELVRLRISVGPSERVTFTLTGAEPLFAVHVRMAEQHLQRNDPDAARAALEEYERASTDFHTRLETQRAEWCRRSGISLPPPLR